MGKHHLTATKTLTRLYSTTIFQRFSLGSDAARGTIRCTADGRPHRNARWSLRSDPTLLNRADNEPLASAIFVFWCAGKVADSLTDWLTVLSSVASVNKHANEAVCDRVLHIVFLVASYSGKQLVVIIGNFSQWAFVFVYPHARSWAYPVDTIHKALQGRESEYRSTSEVSFESFKV